MGVDCSEEPEIVDMDDAVDTLCNFDRASWVDRPEGAVEALVEDGRETLAGVELDTSKPAMEVDGFATDLKEAARERSTGRGST